MTAAVSASGLGKRFGAAWAWHPCDLVVPAGRVIALIGPNGAGKTTLLQLITGLIRPTTGSVAIFDQPDAAGSARALAQVGYVAQEHPIYRRFKVGDLLRLGRELNEGWDQRLAEDRLAGLGIPLEKRASALSGGQQA